MWNPAESLDTCDSGVRALKKVLFDYLAGLGKTIQD